MSAFFNYDSDSLAHCIGEHGINYLCFCVYKIGKKIGRLTRRNESGNKYESNDGVGVSI